MALKVSQGRRGGGSKTILHLVDTITIAAHIYDKQLDKIIEKYYKSYFY